jgi:hypothetical protein
MSLKHAWLILVLGWVFVRSMTNQGLWRRNFSNVVSAAVPAPSVVHLVSCVLTKVAAAYSAVVFGGFGIKITMFGYTMDMFWISASAWL